MRVNLSVELLYGWREGWNPDVFVCNVKAVKMYIDIQWKNITKKEEKITLDVLNTENVKTVILLLCDFPKKMWGPASVVQQILLLSLQMITLQFCCYQVNILNIVFCKVKKCSIRTHICIYRRMADYRCELSTLFILEMFPGSSLSSFRGRTRWVA